jgi:hypothetical protein
MITIYDRDGALSPKQLAELKEKSFPFDAVITIWSGADGKRGLENLALSHVKGANTFSLAQRARSAERRVAVHRVDRIPSGREVTDAGNKFFKSGDMVGGIDAIVERASVLSRMRTQRVENAPLLPPPDAPVFKGEVVTVPAAPAVVVQERPLPPALWWSLGIVAALVVAVVGFWSWQRRKAEREDEARRKREAEQEAERVQELEALRSKNASLDDFDRRLGASTRGGFTRPTAPAQPSVATFRRAVPHRSATPPPAPIAPAPVVVMPDRGSDLLRDVLLVEALTRSGREADEASARRREREREEEERADRRRREAEESSPSSSSSSGGGGWGSSSSDDSSSSSGGSSWDSGSSSSSDSSSSSGGGGWD